MKAQRLFELIGLVDEELVEDALKRLHAVASPWGLQPQPVWYCVWCPSPSPVSLQGKVPPRNLLPPDKRISRNLPWLRQRTFLSSPIPAPYCP